jgi:hypothetical protein
MKYFMLLFYLNCDKANGKLLSSVNLFFRTYLTVPDFLRKVEEFAYLRSLSTHVINNIYCFNKRKQEKIM